MYVGNTNKNSRKVLLFVGDECEGGVTRLVLATPMIHAGGAGVVAVAVFSVVAVAETAAAETVAETAAETTAAVHDAGFVDVIGDVVYDQRFVDFAVVNADSVRSGTGGRCVVDEFRLPALRVIAAAGRHGGGGARLHSVLRRGLESEYRSGVRL